jgi:ABC-type multidrug transport system ATPase subunit
MQAATQFATARIKPVLSMNGIRKTFSRGLARALERTAALNEINLDLRAGDIVCVTGIEGAGKTTLLQCAAGLLRCDAGDIHCYGELFPGGGQVPGFAYVPAVPVFYPFLTVRDVLQYRFAREASKWENSSLAVDKALVAVELDSVGGERVVALTREQVKRLAVAEALVTNPAVVLVDSSVSDLSPAISRETCNALAEFSHQGGAVMIGIRDMRAVAGIATQHVFLESGRVCSPLSQTRFVAETLRALH